MAYYIDRAKEHDEFKVGFPPRIVLKTGAE